MNLDEYKKIESEVEQKGRRPQEGSRKAQVPVIVKFLSLIRPDVIKDQGKGSQLEPKKDCENAPAILQEQTQASQGDQRIQQEKAFIKSKQESYGLCKFQGHKISI